MTADEKRSDWTIRSAGDTGFVVEFGNTVDRRILERVTNLDSAIHKASKAGKFEGLIETVPTFRSLAVILDPLITTPDRLASEINSLAIDDSIDGNDPNRHWKIPICYGDEFGPDLNSVANACGMDEQAIIDAHLAEVYVVYMLGFQPGFAFMGDTHESLQLPRRSEPRLRVPAGSVAMANQLTGIYPWESPGGWHIVGRCPTPLFSGNNNPPALFRSGDKVSFEAIDLVQYQDLMDARVTGTIDINTMAINV